MPSEARGAAGTGPAHPLTFAKDPRALMVQAAASMGLTRAFAVQVATLMFLTGVALALAVFTEEPAVMSLLLVLLSVVFWYIVWHTAKAPCDSKDATGQPPTGRPPCPPRTPFARLRSRTRTPTTPLTIWHKRCLCRRRALPATNPQPAHVSQLHEACHSPHTLTLLSLGLAPCSRLPTPMQTARSTSQSCRTARWARG